MVQLEGNYNVMKLMFIFQIPSRSEGLIGALISGGTA